MENKNTFFDRIKYICSIPVKDEGRALDIIFVLCLICIIALSVFLYKSSTNFYNNLDKKMHEDDFIQNEQLQYIEQILHNKLFE